jgi:hypothetical protein
VSESGSFDEYQAACRNVRQNPGMARRDENIRTVGAGHMTSPCIQNIQAVPAFT